MHLNEAGTIVERQWNWLKEQYSYVILHTFQIMPNHAHGIIEISRDHAGKNYHLNQELIYDEEKELLHNSMQSKSRKIKSISELMGSFKMTSSNQIHLLQYTASDRDLCLPDPSSFTWQRSFYDHIIRDQNSFENISNYIETNPQTWKDDRFFM